MLEIGVQLLEKCERRLAHQFQHGIFGVFGGDLQASRRCGVSRPSQDRAVVEQVVTDATADKGLLDALHGSDLFVQRPTAAGGRCPGWAHLRVQARRTAAFAAQFPVAPAHAVHVGRRRTDVREVTPEVGRRGDPPHLVEDRALAARVDEFAW